MGKFYVYAHRRKTNGEIFYIGKGCGDRMRHFYGKNRWWRSIQAKHGFYAEKIKSNLTEDCAYCIEKILIYANKKKLCNISAGGTGGMAGVKKTKDHVEKVAQKHRGSKRSDRTRGLISIAAKARLADPRNHPRLKLENASWRNECGDEFFGDHLQLSQKYGLSLSSLRKVQSGSLKSYKGWRISSV